MYIPLVFLWTIGLSTAISPAIIPKNGGKIWAFLVAGSNGYFNYRHQADICHAYQILHANGIPDENIIVMMADDIAYSPENPTPGIILNSPGGPNVYGNMPKDYTGEDVNPINFLNVLTGNKTGVKGIGSGRVIESGPEDHIFVNFVDHGGSGVLCFPRDVLTADELVKAISFMAAKSKFARMVLYIEACYSGSVFDDILSDDLNTLVVTASDPHESSYACYYDPQRKTYLGDVFSVSWMNDTEHEALSTESIHHQFERVRTVTNTSHVEEYGDLDIGVMKLSEVIGFNTDVGARNTIPLPRISKYDVVSNIDVPLDVLERRIRDEKDENKRKKMKYEKHHLIKKRSVIDQTLERIVAVAAVGDSVKKNDLKLSKYKLGKTNFPCYKTLLSTFSQRCFNVAQNPYVRAHLSKLVNMCAAPWLNIHEAIRAIVAVCRKSPKRLIGVM